MCYLPPQRPRDIVFIPSVPDKAVHLFTNAFQFPFLHPMQCWNWSKIVHTLCMWGWGGGEGADQSCVAKKKRLNRLFVASHSRGKKPPYWKARYALGKDKQKEITIFKNDVKLFCLVPLRPLHSSMVVRFKLRISQSRMWADKNSSSQFLWS